MPRRSERFPNLFVVGAMKAGTTTLHQVLGHHSQIYMSPVKEPKFFAFQHDQALFSGPKDPGNQRRYVDRQRYLALFEHWQGERYAGESSTIYLYRAEAARNIHQTAPDSRILIMLREPVERAFSNFVFARQLGLEPESSFRRALELEDDRIAAGWGPLWHYRYKSLYGAQVERYMQLFGHEQVFVGLFDELVASSRLFYAKVLDFLNVPEEKLPLDVAANRSHGLRAPLLERFLRFAARHPSSSLLTRGPGGRLLRGTALRLRRWNAIEPPLLPPQDAAWLRQFFRRDLEQLETLLSRSLTSWRSA